MSSRDPFEDFIAEACDHGEAMELMDALVSDPEEQDAIEHAEIDRMIRDKWERVPAGWHFVDTRPEYML